MAQTPLRCQQESSSRWLLPLKMWGVLVLFGCCGGCWQEVPYGSESPPEKTTPTKTAEELPAETSTQAVASAAKGPRTVEVLQVPVPEEDLQVEMSAELEVWQLASRWSMAAAWQAKQGDAEIYAKWLEQARQGASVLGVTLPELPIFEDGAKRLPVTLGFLLKEAGPRLLEDLNEKHGTKHAALATLATKSNVLLLVYTPKSTRIEPVITAIREAAAASGLPESVWRELVDLLADRADFKQVKAAVYQLHQRAVVALGGENAS